MTAPELIKHVDQSIAKALRGESKLDAETLAIKGFSTPTIRHMFNQLCSLPVTTYLEAGIYFGGSLCAAACNNKHLTSFALEDFSQDFSEQGVRESLLKSIEAVRPKTGSLSFIEGDCFEMDLARIDKPIDVMFYDANHDESCQRKAWSHFADKLADVAAVVVDDFSWVPVELGCRAGIADVADKLKVVKEWVLSDGQPDGKRWHNDVFIAVTERI